MQEILLKIRYFERRFSKTFQNLTLIFPLHPVPFYGKDCEQQMGTSLWFMLTNSGHHDYSSFIWPFESENCGKERQKIEKIEYLENKKSFLDEIKSIFYNFWNAFLV